MSDMSLQAVMNLQTSGFTNPLSSVRSALTGTIAKMAGIAGVGISVAGTFSALKSALNMGGQMSELSDRTGIAVGQLVTLRQAFQDTGVGAESGVQAIAYMQRNLSGIGETANRIGPLAKQLGLNMSALRTQAPTEQLQTIGKAFRTLKDPAQQTAVAMELFGRSGAAMKQFFADPAAIETAAKSLGSMPALVQQNAALFDAIGDAWGRLKTKLQGFWVGIMAGIAPAFKSITDAVDKVDFAKWGEKIGNVIGTIIELFRSGGIGTVIGNSLKVGFGEAVNYLTGTLGNLDFWLGLFQVIEGALRSFSAAVWSILLGWIPAFKRAMQGVLRDSREMMASGMENIQNGFRSSNLIDTSEWRAELSDVWTKASADMARKRAEMQAAAGMKAAPGTETIAAALKAEKPKSFAADALARIGGFIGGGGPQLDHARRTAAATERTAKGVEKLLFRPALELALNWGS